jgi:adenylosuccinate lyase
MRKGRDNDLLRRLRAIPALGKVLRARPRLMKVEGYVGRAPSQVEEYVRSEVDPILKGRKTWLGMQPCVRV